VSIKYFQEEEVIYATEIAEVLNIPLFVSTGADDIKDALDFILAIIRRKPNGW
jgi:hypothetical protein